MNLNVKRQIADLRKMPAARLREKHQEVFGEPSRSGHREYLFRRIAWKTPGPGRGRPIRAGAPPGGRIGPQRRSPHLCPAGRRRGPSRSGSSGSLRFPARGRR